MTCFFENLKILKTASVHFFLIKNTNRFLSFGGPARFPGESFDSALQNTILFVERRRLGHYSQYLVYLFGFQAPISLFEQVANWNNFSKHGVSGG